MAPQGRLRGGKAMGSKTICCQELRALRLLSIVWYTKIIPDFYDDNPIS